MNKVAHSILFIAVICFSTLCSGFEIPPSVKIIAPHHIAPGEEFSITINIVRGTKNKKSFEIKDLEFDGTDNLSTTQVKIPDRKNIAPVEISGFSAVSPGICVINGTLHTEGYDIAFTSEPILCIDNWDDRNGTYFAAGITDTYGESVFDDEATLGIARCFSPSHKLFDIVALRQPIKVATEGVSELSVELRAEGGTSAKTNIILEIQVVQMNGMDEPDIIASRVVTNANLTNRESYHPFKLNFIQREENANLEIRIIYFGYAKIFVDRIIVSNNSE